MRHNNQDPIELELDPDEIAILKEGGRVCKETDDSDLPVLFIYKWDVIRELQDDMEGEEGLADIIFDPDKPIKVSKKYPKTKYAWEAGVEGTAE